MTDVWKLGLTQGLEKLAERSLSASNWVRSLVDRQADCEAAVGAWAQVDRAGALARAEDIGARLALVCGPGAADDATPEASAADLKATITPHRPARVCVHKDDD